MDRAEATRRLIASKVGSIATVRPDGSPHVVPFVFAVSETRDGLVIYWCVDDKPKRSRQLQRLVGRIPIEGEARAGVSQRLGLQRIQPSTVAIKLWA